MGACRKGQKLSNPAGRERHLRWLGLRKQGLTYDQIAAQEGVCRQAVHQAVRNLIQVATRDAVGDLVQLEQARLDELQRNVWPQATTPGDEAQLPAIDRIIRIMERRAKMLGLDGKETGTEGAEARDVPIEELRELLSGLGFELVKKNDEEEPSSDG